MSPIFLNRIARHLCHSVAFAACALAPFTPLHAEGTNVMTLGIRADGTVDSTASIQKLLNEGPSELFFPDGTYKIGTLNIPGNKSLVFAPGAKLELLPEKITDKNLFVIAGDHVRIRGLSFDFAWNRADLDTTPLHNLIYVDGFDDLVVSDMNVVNTDERGIVPLEDRKRRGRLQNMDGTDPAKNYSHIGYYNSQRIVFAINSSNIVLENSGGERLHAMIETNNSSNVTVRGNRMVSGNAMTSFREGGECLRHHDNWSRDVKYQVVWFGGSPDPSRKRDTVPSGTSTVVDRDVKLGDPGYNEHTSGSFDVFVQNNYAEYGNTLAWGNKGRQIVIDGNIARFIADYAYGSEGGENIVFSNNISINSTAGGIVSMYWGEKLLITGNLVLVRHEPWSAEWSWWDQPAKYLGPFVRLHHGPANDTDPYGAGTVQISGNLFVNELSGRSTPISIQAGRDVTVSGNKFINGRVDKFGFGRVTVTDNEFVSRLDFDDIAVSVKGEADLAMVKGNIFRKEQARSSVSDAEKASEQTAVPYFLFTEEDAPVREGAEDDISKAKAEKKSLPAITFRPQGKFFGLVQDNVILGWGTSVSAALANGDTQSTLVVTGNTIDGKFDGEVNESTKFENNISIPQAQ